MRMSAVLASVGSGKDGAYHRAGDGDLGKLESAGTGMTHDAGPDLDQFDLEAAQQPVGHRFGKLDAAQEGREVVGQRLRAQGNWP